jgi:hypothetical protein
MLYLYCSAFGCTVCTLAIYQIRAVFDVNSFSFKCHPATILLAEVLRLLKHPPHQGLLNQRQPCRWNVFSTLPFINMMQECVLISFEVPFPKSPNSKPSGFPIRSLVDLFCLEALELFIQFSNPHFL